MTNYYYQFGYLFYNLIQPLNKDLEKGDWNDGTNFTSQASEELSYSPTWLNR